MIGSSYWVLWISMASRAMSAAKPTAVEAAPQNTSVQRKWGAAVIQVPIGRAKT